MKKMLIAAVASLAVAAPALVAPAAAAPKREEVSLALSTKGVDFANPQSIEAFRARAYDQIVELCNPNDRISRNDTTDKQCRRELAAKLSSMLGTLAIGPAAGKATRN